MKSRILRGADGVLVWLRPANRRMDSTDTMGMPGIGSHLNQAADMQYMGSRPYWSRLWVFLELKSAREVELACGSITLWWEDSTVAIRGERIKSLIDLEREYPWAVDDYLAADIVTQRSTALIPTA